jgi:hypothetical protein
VELLKVAMSNLVGNGAKWTLRGLGAVGAFGGARLEPGTLRNGTGVTGKQATLRAGSSSVVRAVVGRAAAGRGDESAGLLDGAISSVGGETTAFRRSVIGRMAS